MNKKKIYTKEDLVALFEELNIKKGTPVFVESDLNSFSSIAGGEQTLIEALKETIGSQGCLIMPSFSFSTLDPATHCFTRYPYSLWSSIRESMNGYNAKITASNTVLSDLLLRYPGVYRTSHPVYSFIYYGKYKKEWTEQSMNDPISLNHVLQCFRSREARLLLFDMAFEDSCLSNAFAHEFEQEVTIIERAYLDHKKQRLPRTFLIGKTRQSFIHKFRKHFKKRERQLNDHTIASYALETSFESLAAIFSKSAIDSLESPSN